MTDPRALGDEGEYAAHSGPETAGAPAGQVAQPDDERAIARMLGPYPGYEPGELDRGHLGRIASALERLCELFDVGPRDELVNVDVTPGPDSPPYGGEALAQAFQEWARRIEWSSAAWSELTEGERRAYVAIVTGIEDRADEIRRGSQRCCAADDMAREADPETFPGHSAWCTHDTHPHGERCALGCPCGRGKVSNR